MPEDAPFSANLSSSLIDLACALMADGEGHSDISEALVGDAVDFCLAGPLDGPEIVDWNAANGFLKSICARMERGSLDPAVPMMIFGAVRDAAVALQRKRIADETDPKRLMAVFARSALASQQMGIKLGRLYSNAKREAGEKEQQIERLKDQRLKFVSKKGGGWIDVGGTRMCLLDVSNGWLSLAEAIKLVAGEDTYKRAVFEAGRQGTFPGTALERRFITRSPDGFREAVDTFSSAGFGSFRIEELKFSDGFARISCPDAFEAWAFLQRGKSSSVPVCHYSTGVLLSFMEQITRRSDITATERKCIAKGDDCCEFVVGTEEQIEEIGLSVPRWGMTIKEKAECLENLLVENEKVQAVIRLRNLELSALNKIISTVSRSLDLQEVVELAVSELRTIVSDKAVAVFVIDHASQRLILAAQQGFSDEFVSQMSQMKISEGLAGMVARERCPIACDDYTRFPEAVEAACKIGNITSLLSVPLMSVHGIHGVLNVASTKPYHFTSEEINLMSLIGYQIGSAMDRARLYEEMRQNERLASIGKLASILAHEIRNPLSSIKTNIQVLARKLDLEGFDKDRLDIAHTEIMRLERVLKEMLDFARPVQATKSAYVIDQVVDRCLELLKDGLKNAGIRVVRKKTRSKRTVMADNEKLQEALLNILLNAVDSMPDGGTLRISTRWSLHGKRRVATVEIRDTGMGIASAHLAKIFDPFFSTKTRGVGLGLTNVKNVIEVHGGSVEVESSVPGGTSFIITLPER
ncbi:MAG: ATP-binding protein [Pseudomonadota bacterium]